MRFSTFQVNQHTILKIKWVMRNMLFFDVLACPAYEHFVIHVCLDGQT